MITSYSQEEIKKDYLKSCIILNDIKFFINASKLENVAEKEEVHLLICIKNNLIPLKNLLDVKPSLNKYIIDDEYLQNLSKSLNKNLELINKLRNKISGHLDDDVLKNAINWEPYIFAEPSEKSYKNDAQNYLIYKSLFESVVNAYVEQNGIFAEELDLFIPEDRTKLLEFIDITNNMAIDFLQNIIEKLDSYISYWNQDDGNIFLQSIKKASQVDFKIQKKKRH